MVKAEIVVQSHLSDALIEISSNPSLAGLRMRFIKYLIATLDGDLSEEIEPEGIFQRFLEINE